jgi:CBS domain-containing protein
MITASYTGRFRPPENPAAPRGTSTANTLLAKISNSYSRHDGEFVTSPPEHPPATALMPLVAEVMSHPELYAADDLTVSNALMCLHAAAASHLLVLDADGRCRGLVTASQLATHQTREPWYLRRTRIIEIELVQAPFATPGMSAADATALMHTRGVDVLPVVDDDGYPVGVVTGHQLDTRERHTRRRDTAGPR